MPSTMLLETALKTEGKRQTKKSLFIFGVGGFVGKRLAKFCATSLRTEFAEVGGTTRTKDDSVTDYNEYQLGEDGTLPIEALEALKRATHVLSTVPVATDNTLDDGLIEAKAQRGQLEWAGYLSTTATYGDRGGSKADEDDAVEEKALSERGLARLRMEEKWRKTGAPVHIYRLPGIYGPGRGPLAKARESSNRLLVKENQVFCRIHVDDIVQVLVLSMRSPNPGRIYNVGDDEPAPSHTVSLYAYSLLQKQPPPLARYEDVENDLSPMVRSFYAECKRISSDRAKMELGFIPIFRTYHEGLQAQYDEEVDSFKVVPVSSSLPVKRFASSTKAVQVVASGAWITWITRFRAFVQLVVFFLLAKARSIYEEVRFLFKAKVSGCAVIFVDNGSVRPGATLGMRRLANKLQARLRINVSPTSWRYADRIDSRNFLQGESAVLFPKAVEQERSKFVVILPLFLGPSVVITRDIPRLLNRSTQIIARPLADSDSDAASCEITALLRNAALALLGTSEVVSKRTRILLVDHGSPNREVNRVRRALAARLRASMYPAVVVDCSMERRPEPDYDFNEPTLENAFQLGGFDSGDVIVVPAFLFPGNHAGPGGDIETIIGGVLKRKPLLKVKMARLLMDEANDDLVVHLLETRVRKALL